MAEDETNIEFETIGDDPKPIRIEGSYVRQRWRPFGVDLELTTGKPVHHWRLYGANGTLGSVIRTGEEVAIFSKTRKASLVSWWQTFGINLDWWVDPVFRRQTNKLPRIRRSGDGTSDGTELD